MEVQNIFKNEGCGFTGRLDVVLTREIFNIAHVQKTSPKHIEKKVLTLKEGSQRRLEKKRKQSVARTSQ